MPTDMDFNKILNILYESARTSFRETHQYRLLCEKHNTKATEYEATLQEQQLKLINEYLAVLNELHVKEAEYLYVQGYKDGITILKTMGVL